MYEGRGKFCIAKFLVNICSQCKQTLQRVMQFFGKIIKLALQPARVVPTAWVRNKITGLGRVYFKMLYTVKDI